MKSKRILLVTACAAFAVMLGLSATATVADDSVIGPKNSHAETQQRLFARINLAPAWEITKGSPDILVGMIDNGYDFFHPDLKGQLLPGYYFAGGFHTEFYEGIAHGTLVSSIIVAKDDQQGMTGLAPECRVLTASQGMLEHKLLKLQQELFRNHPKATLADWQKEIVKHIDVLRDFGEGWVSYQLLGAAEAIHYLVDHGARLINISGAIERSLCPSDDVWMKVEEAFAYAASKDVVIVLAAGNNAAKWEGYPGNAKTVIVVGASLLDDSRWEQEQDLMGTKIKQGSNYGSRLTLMAPIENLLTCVPHDPRCYDITDGPMGPAKVPFDGILKVHANGATSSAAPIISSLVALMLSANPELDAKTVVELLKRSCDDLGTPGYDIYTGYGRVNFGKTLKLVQQEMQNK